MAETVRGLEAELESTAILRDTAGDRIAKLAEMATSLRAEVDDVHEQLAVVEDERDAARGQHEELFHLINARDEEIMQARRSYVDLTQRLQEKELELAAYQSTDLILEDLERL